MEHRELGGTGLSVSRMGIGRPAYINLGHSADLAAGREVDTLRQRTADVLDAAWNAGITYVDAARSYGRAEEFLASWLRVRDGGHPVVGSKWGYAYTGDWRLDAETHEVKEHSLAMFERQYAETSALLGTDLDLYQVHSLTPDSGALDDDALLDALGALRARGTPVGVSLSGPDQADALARAMAVERDGVRLFSTVQATWNVLEPSVGDMLRTAAEAGMGVIVKEGVANGRLTPRSAEPAVQAVVVPIADREGVGTDAVALAAVLAQSWADVVLSGVTTVPHLRANLRAFDVVLTPEDTAALQTLAERPDAYWRRRAGMEWT
jgi:aryl-alcohol dehydrogenase-like predicted oxidoreductase